MIYPCQISSKDGSPGRCHCVECKHQVDKATTAMALWKQTSSPRPSETPILLHTLNLAEPHRLSSELNHGSRTSDRRSTSRRGTKSMSSRPRHIPISMDEVKYRRRELQDMNETETHYANATWRMYRRITSYRIDHPLPDCYYNDDNVTNTSDHDTLSSNNDIQHENKNETITNDIMPFKTIQQKDVEDDDDEHLMMFDLDME